MKLKEQPNETVTNMLKNSSNPIQRYMTGVYPEPLVRAV